MTPEREDIDPAARRFVGVAALRRLRRLVDEDQARTQHEARWASRIALAFLAAATFILFLWLAKRML